MKVRFQADADLNEIIVKATLRREPTIDFQTAHAAQLAGLLDREVLAAAARENRLLVSHDRKTMPRHFADFIKNQMSSGVIIIPQKLSISIAVEELALIWTATEIARYDCGLGKQRPIRANAPNAERRLPLACYTGLKNWRIGRMVGRRKSTTLITT